MSPYKITPPPDFGRDPLFARQPLAHAPREQQRRLVNMLALHSQSPRKDHRTEIRTFGSMNSGTPKSTAFLLMT